MEEAAPVRAISDANGHVQQLEYLKMELGEPDESGRRRPVPKEGSKFQLDCDLAVISGPTFAAEVARGLPTAVTVAANNPMHADRVAGYLHGEQFRAYTSDDLIGVQVGGASKNVLAIAAGIADGDDPSVPGREGARFRTPRIEGDDPGVQQHEIGGLRRRVGVGVCRGRHGGRRHRRRRCSTGPG